MTQTYVRPAATTFAAPIYSTLVQFPAVSFTLALITDVFYWSSANVMWQNFSSWLLFAGLVTGAATVLAGIVDFVLNRGDRATRPALAHAAAGLAVFVLAFLNSLVHAGDGWTAVVPWGLVLSVLTVLAMVATDWLGRPLILQPSLERE